MCSKKSNKHQSKAYKLDPQTLLNCAHKLFPHRVVNLWAQRSNTSFNVGGRVLYLKNTPGQIVCGFAPNCAIIVDRTIQGFKFQCSWNSLSVSKTTQPYLNAPCCTPLTLTLTISDEVCAAQGERS